MAVPPPFRTIDKAALRAWMRDARDAFVRTAPPPITPPREFLDLLAPGAIVASYHPVGSEADPAPLVRAALDHGCTLALPHVTGRAQQMRFLVWHPDHDLVAGPFGLSQPHSDQEAVSPDIVLTPLIGYDHALNRLGQGAGHYDRAFAALASARRIGVAWSVQHLDPLPADPWDVPLHAVITEQGWIERPTP